MFRKLLDEITKIDEKSKRYFVMAGGGVSEPYTSKEASSPEAAVRMWFRFQNIRSLDVWIDATPEDGEELLSWAKANKEKIRKIASEFKHPFNIDVWLEGIDNAKIDTSMITTEFSTTSIPPFVGG